MISIDQINGNPLSPKTFMKMNHRSSSLPVSYIYFMRLPPDNRVSNTEKFELTNWENFSFDDKCGPIILIIF